LDTRLRIGHAFHNHRLRNILIALVCAVIAVVAATSYARHYKRDVKASGALTTVFIASTNIPAGTPGKAVAKRVHPAEVARGNLVTGAISNPATIASLVTSTPILEGEQLTLQRFQPLREQGVRGEIAGKYRIVEVPGDEHQLLVGTLQAGDRVDVLASVDVPRSSGGDVPISTIVLRNLLVLEAADEPKGSAGSDKTTSLLLSITDADAQKLFFVMKNADWSLQLRPRFGRDSGNSVDSYNSVIGSQLSAKQRAILRRAIATGGSG
jgi:Flp pilus assembly protein CpaB